jgi:hypothetical protein
VDAFVRAFERRARAGTKATGSVSDLEKQLDAERRRVENATRLIIDDPGGLDLRRARETDKAEVRRLEAALAEASKSKRRALPGREAIRAVFTGFVDLVESTAQKAPERSREALARIFPEYLTNRHAWHRKRRTRCGSHRVRRSTGDTCKFQ